MARAELDEQTLVSELTKLLSPSAVLSGTSTKRAYDCDAYTIDRSAPTAVVLPSNIREAQAVIQWCNQYEIPFTPRGAGTGLSGGAMPALGGVVISTKWLNRILEVDIPNRRLHAEAGVVNLNLTREVSKFGLHFAPDPSSQSVSTLGGNIAENSGGPHTLKYGVTAPHILGVRMISPNGELDEVWRSPNFDYIDLIVGSEGTLGFVVDAWIALTELPEFTETALVAFSTPSQATEAVSKIMQSGVIPAALEMMDANILVALKAAFGLEFPEGTGALLLIECDGAPPDVAREMKSVETMTQAVGRLNFQVAADKKERERLWTARKKGIGAMGRLAPAIVTHDGVIPRSKLPAMLEFVYEVAREQGIGVANLFHAGDGNLHPCFYFDDRDPKQIEAVVHAGELIIAKCIELGGSVSGEHGIGIEKSSLLTEMFAPADLDAQLFVRDAFVTHNLCNPCKILPNQKGCTEHARRWRGVAT